MKLARNHKINKIIIHKLVLVYLCIIKLLSAKKLRFIEFLIIGVLLGIIEDLIAIFFATDAKIDLGVIWVAFIVALPFAVFSELVVDHPRFWELFFKKKTAGQ